MVKLGFHISIAGSIDLAVDRALELSCDTFQIFTRNPRSWATRALKEVEVESFREKRSVSGINPAYGHMPYILNLASPHKRIYNQSIASLVTGLGRCDSLGLPMLVTHIGSHMGKGSEAGVARVIEALNKAFERDGSEVEVLLETGSGFTNSVGSTFEELRRILDGVVEKRRVAVCFDTCHTFVAGYELRSSEGLGKTLDAFDRFIGLDRLKLVHLNDSVGSFRSGKDHHEHIGLGEIGVRGFRLIVNSRLSRVPMIMETPIDDRRGNQGNMEVVRGLLGQN
ncbi:MAG: deoxyribonuclease IV [Candidatus Bathyarchaeota archaeon]|jgi:deoxyribonuclease-4